MQIIKSITIITAMYGSTVVPTYITYATDAMNSINVSRCAVDHKQKFHQYVPTNLTLTNRSRNFLFFLEDPYLISLNQFQYNNKLILYILF